LHRLIAPALAGAFSHSITTSAATRSVGDTVSPSALKRFTSRDSFSRDDDFVEASWRGRAAAVRHYRIRRRGTRCAGRKAICSEPARCRPTSGWGQTRKYSLQANVSWSFSNIGHPTTPLAPRSLPVARMR
jgi:hypothetical protein